MSTSMDSAARVMSGTHGEAWMDDELCGETLGLQAKVAGNKEDVPMCGQFMVDTKLMSAKGTGSIRFHKVNSRMAIKMSDNLKAGRDTRVKLISKLDDPDAYGAERVVIYDASFDDLTLADWEAAAKGQIECPFTFTRWEFLDLVQPRKGGKHNGREKAEIRTDYSGASAGRMQTRAAGAAAPLQKLDG